LFLFVGAKYFNVAIVLLSWFMEWGVKFSTTIVVVLLSWFLEWWGAQLFIILLHLG
jgi:hypothetical protein